jgi:hypothetical protein
MAASSIKLSQASGACQSPEFQYFANRRLTPVAAGEDRGLREARGKLRK